MEGRSCKMKAESAYHERKAAVADWRKGLPFCCHCLLNKDI